MNQRASFTARTTRVKNNTSIREASRCNSLANVNMDFCAWYQESYISARGGFPIGMLEVGRICCMGEQMLRGGCHDFQTQAVCRSGARSPGPRSFERTTRPIKSLDVPSGKQPRLWLSIDLSDRPQSVECCGRCLTPDFCSGQTSDRLSQASKLFRSDMAGRGRLMNHNCNHDVSEHLSTDAADLLSFLTVRLSDCNWLSTGKNYCSNGVVMLKL